MVIQKILEILEDLPLIDVQDIHRFFLAYRRHNEFVRLATISASPTFYGQLGTTYLFRDLLREIYDVWSPICQGGVQDD